MRLGSVERIMRTLFVIRYESYQPMYPTQFRFDAIIKRLIVSQNDLTNCNLKCRACDITIRFAQKWQYRIELNRIELTHYTINVNI